jgi:hypothetical protein
MPRPDISMTPAEVAAFLAAKRTAVVATLGPDGAPDGEPVRFQPADGGVRFDVAANGPTHRNLARDPRAVVALEEFPSYAAIRGVTLHGRVTLAPERDGRVPVRLDPARVESFDFRKMKR